ncbi:MAG TPA: CapA family protein [Bacteroidetes bacterium]|nr:CapA family protein [Bacteroidota bacterium]HEX04565.1 CapA family protein [Bacteroidota bacterium]
MLNGAFVKPIIIAMLLLLSSIINPGFAQQDEISTVRLGFTGDIFLGNWATAFIDTFGVDYPFVETTDLFNEMDLVVANLESPITSSDEPYVEKSYLLKARPGISQGLLNANIRAVTLANNHILDYGLAGLTDTFNELDATGIQHFGAGMNVDEALREASFEINGQTIALLGFSATFPEEFWASDTSAGTAFPYDEDVRRRVSQCAAEYDIVVAIFHWGAEKRDTPKDYQVDLAHLCIDNGADFVVGHHPHVVQGIEIYKDVPIFYSLGNFAFASYSETARVGLIADITFEDGAVSEARVIPVNVYNAEVNFQPVGIEGSERADFYAYLLTISEALNPLLITVSADGSIEH